MPFVTLATLKGWLTDCTACPNKLVTCRVFNDPTETVAGSCLSTCAARTGFVNATEDKLATLAWVCDAVVLNPLTVCPTPT